MINVCHVCSKLVEKEEDFGFYEDDAKTGIPSRKTSTWFYKALCKPCYEEELENYEEELMVWTK